MNRTTGKFLERLTIVVVVSVLGFLAESAGALGPYGPALASAASMLLLLVGKLAPAYVPAQPEPQPAPPVIPPAPAFPTPPGTKLLTNPKGESFLVQDVTFDPAPVAFSSPPEVVPFVTPGMARACEIRGLAYPTTPEDRVAAYRMAATDALSYAGVRPVEPPDPSIAP